MRAQTPTKEEAPTPTKEDTGPKYLPKEATEIRASSAKRPAMKKIKMRMGTYSQKFGGQVRLDQIMEAVNTKYWDLPFLNKHVNVNGSEKLCWLSVLRH